MRLCLLVALLLSSIATATTKRALVGVGDSLTYGYAVSTVPYPVALEGLTGLPVDNLGVGGNRTAAAYARWVSYAKRFPYKYLIILIGTNDLALDGSTGAYVWGIVQPWIEEAQAAGQTVITCTISPRNTSPNWDATKELERQDFNASLRAYVLAHPSTILVDLDTVMSDDGVTLRVAYDFSDHLHFNDAGMAALAAGIKAAASL